MEFKEPIPEVPLGIVKWRLAQSVDPDLVAALRERLEVRTKRGAVRLTLREGEDMPRVGD